MKLIVAGCRYVDKHIAYFLIKSALSASPWQYEDIKEVIHGGASGIDSAAGEYFKDDKYVTVYAADWDIHGKAAGPIRNRKMASVGNALLAIWDGKSAGTKNMIEEAVKAGLQVFIYPLK